MEIASISHDAIAEIFGRNPSLDKLNKISENLDNLANANRRQSSNFSNVDSQGRVPSINRILPSLIKQLSELDGDAGQYTASLNADGKKLPKNSADLSPLSFLNQDERTELKSLLTDLQQINNSSENSSSSTSYAAHNATTNSASENNEQWALFSALKRVDNIISRGEDHLHDSVNSQLSDTQQISGNFLPNEQQEEVIALLGQKSLLEAKAKDSPLSDTEKQQLDAINTQVTKVFAAAENTLKGAGVDVNALKSHLEAGTATQNIDNIVNSGNKSPLNAVQSDLASILKDNDDGDDEGNPIADNYVLNNLSAQQQVNLSLANPADFNKAINIYEQLGNLTAKSSLTGAEAKQVSDLTKQSSELLQKSAGELKAQGVNLPQLTKLLTSETPPTQQELTTALGVKAGQPLNKTQDEALTLVSENFLETPGALKGDVPPPPAGSRREANSDSEPKATSSLGKIEYPARLTPLQAIQKRLDKAVDDRKEADKTREKTQLNHNDTAVANKQQTVSMQPVEVARSVPHSTVAGFGNTGIGRSTS